MSVRTHHHREGMRDIFDAKLVFFRFKCIKLNFCVSCHAIFHYYPSPQPSTMLSQLREHPPMKVCLRRLWYISDVSLRRTLHIMSLIKSINHAIAWLTPCDTSKMYRNYQLSTSAPSSVTRTIISHCAEGNPSSVYTSQPFSSSI